MRIKIMLTMSMVLALFALQLIPSPGSRVPDSHAATANPSPASPGYTPMVIPVFGTFTGASTKTVIKFKAPNGYRVMAANATARASSGTNPTLKLVGKSGAYVNYSGTITAGAAPKDLATTAYKITDEVAHQIDLVVGGTSPVWKDITVMLLLKRL